MSIPIFILEKQLCSQCQKYLTVGPVKVYPNRQVRCGRCVKENDNGVESNLFSTVMKGMVFPCINSLEGCSEEFSIQQMKNHEKDCLENIFSCPICDKFEGSSYALNRHCKSCHKNEELKVKAFPINLNQGNSQCVYFYSKNKMLLFICQNYEVDLNNIRINISFLGDKYNGDVHQSVSLYTIDHQLKYRTQIKPCSKLNSTESDGFTIDISQLNFTKNLVFCEFDIIEKSILSLVEKQLLIDPVLDNFKARCKFDNISKIVEKIYFPAVYYFSDITWKVFIEVVDNHVEVGLCWEKTNNTTILDLYNADINLTLLSSKKHIIRKVEQIKLESFNVLKFKLGTVFNLASRNEIIQNDSINIEVKVNIYLHTKTNEKRENSCAHCGCNCVSQDIKKLPGNDKRKCCKVDDEVDSRCTTMEVIQHHNGGHEEDIDYTLAYVKGQELYMTIQGSHKGMDRDYSPRRDDSPRNHKDKSYSSPSRERRCRDRRREDRYRDRGDRDYSSRSRHDRSPSRERRVRDLRREDRYRNRGDRDYSSRSRHDSYIGPKCPKRCRKTNMSNKKNCQCRSAGPCVCFLDNF